MSDRILLGETRRDAISRVQERLGPATSRPLAEKTFWALARKGVITMDPCDGTYLIEAAIEDADIQDTAQVQMKAETRHGVQYNVNRNHFHRARVAWNWKAHQASIFSPSLDSSEGYDPDQNDGE